MKGRPKTRRRFALDHNFPEPIVDALAEYVVSAELTPVRRLDPTYATLDDWELFIALHTRHPRFDGLITCDASLLNLPREMAVLCQTKLTLVVARGEGDNPIKSTGTVLAHVDNIAARCEDDVAQVWDLRLRGTPHSDPWERIEVLARHAKKTAKALFDEYKVRGPSLLRGS